MNSDGTDHGRTSFSPARTRSGRLPLRRLTPILAGLALVAACAAPPAESADRSSLSPTQGIQSHGIVGSVSASMAGADSLVQAELARPDTLAGISAETAAAVRAFYAARHYQPAWTGPAGLTEGGHRLAQAMAETEALGLPAVRLPTAAVARDIALSASALTVARALQGGRLEPVDDMQEAYPPQVSGDVLLASLAAAPDPGQALRALAPDTPLYRGLERGLHQYLALQEAGGWQPVPPFEGRKMEAGAVDPRVIPALRARLKVTGDYIGGDVSSATYDPVLVEAVKRFQDSHGLEVDGILGRETLAALNVPVAQRIHQIRVNLDRLRWLPDDLGQRYVLVNIAGFRVYLFDGQDVTLRSNIIVGNAYRQTPSFSGKATTVVVNPYWNVPSSIAKEELLPKIAADPGYLARKDFQVLAGWNDNTEIDPAQVDWKTLAAEHRFPYRLRKRPGATNDLGRVKILFPNQHAVYLHDTPAKGLFQRRVRTFSHGCMRVEKPVELAALLLGRDPQDLQRLIESGENTVLPLPRKVPVHVTYLTAWAEPGETGIQFRPDIYDRDPPLMQMMAMHSGS